MSAGINDTDTRKLKQQAIEWLVRLRDDTLDDEEMKAFTEWLALDSRHPQAFAYAEDLFDDMVLAVKEQAVAANVPDVKQQSRGMISTLNSMSDLAKKRESIPSRGAKGVWGWGLLAAAAVWLFAVILVLPKDSYPFTDLVSDYHTETGEFRDVQLADGSRILLNTNSAVSIDFDNTKRQITLHHGQARFTVAKDQSRPFEVRADELNIRALGTVFDVYHPNDEETRIVVQEHSVQVDIARPRGNQKRRAIGARLTEGQRLHYRLGDGLSSIEQVNLGQVTSWQKRRLVINDRPLGELIEELNRYRAGRIFVKDSQLSNLRVTGVFSLEHPDKILNSVCRVLDLKETKLAGMWVLLHR